VAVGEELVVVVVVVVVPLGAVVVVHSETKTLDHGNHLAGRRADMHRKVIAGLVVCLETETRLLQGGRHHHQVSHLASRGRLAQAEMPQQGIEDGLVQIPFETVVTS
jgi:hypothetical protein